LLTDRAERATYEQWQNERETGTVSTEIPSQFVDNFLNLFSKVQDPERMSYLGGRPLQPSPEQEISVEHLNRLRGDLIHFSSSSLVVDSREILISVADAVDVIAYLLTEAQPIPLTLPELQEEAEELLVAVRREIDAVREIMNDLGSEVDPVG
jgi:hypothetical protein